MEYLINVIILIISIGSSFLSSSATAPLDKDRNLDGINVGVEYISPSINLNCHINLKYDAEGTGQDEVLNIKILLNDSIGIFSIQDFSLFFNRKFVQFSLSKDVVDCFKALLFDLYTNNNSALTAKPYTADEIHVSTQTLWKISLHLGEKKIDERFNLDKYIGFENPFQPQFIKILDLIWAIKYKIDRDLFHIKRHRNIAEWITEMFHDKYYEPYNNVNSNNIK